jgi:hypothetical protein
MRFYLHRAIVNGLPALVLAACSPVPASVTTSAATAPAVLRASACSAMHGTDPGSLVVVHKYDQLACDTEPLLCTVYTDVLPRWVQVAGVLDAFDTTGREAVACARRVRYRRLSE